MDFNLSDDEKIFLLKIARETIHREFSSHKIHLIDNRYAALDQITGVFITLTQKGQLRGCIGNIIGQYPLYLGVQKMAIQSAFNDPRFSPVSEAEFPDIHIEISVLSPLFEINQNQVEVGKHGLLIKRGLASGVLLPQVPVEQGWSKQEYLEGVCRKAGLANDAYLDKQSQLFGFTALVFSEGDH